MSDHLSLPTTFCVSRYFLYSKWTAICDHLYNATTGHDLCATGPKLTCQWATTNIKNVVPTSEILYVAGRSLIRFTIMLLCPYSLTRTIISTRSLISLFFIKCLPADDRPLMWKSHCNVWAMWSVLNDQIDRHVFMSSLLIADRRSDSRQKKFWVSFVPKLTCQWATIE